MSDKFLNTGGSGGVDISNGTVNAYLATLTTANLSASMPIKTNSVSTLISSKLDISDIKTLESRLNSSIYTPYNGTIKATDFETDDYFSVNTEIQKIDNFTASTQSPDITNLTGLLNTDGLSADRLYDSTSSTYIELDGTDIEVSSTNFTFNSNPVISGFDAVVADNTIPRYDGTSGKAIKGSGTIIDELGNITGINDLTATGDITTARVNGLELIDDNTSIGIGNTALESMSVATQYNIAIGDSALNALTGNSDDNIAIGYSSNSSGANKDKSIAIGSLTDTGAYSNVVALGFSALSTANNQITLGDTNMASTVPGGSSHDLGSSSKKFKDLYLSGDINVGGVILPSVDATSDLGSSSKKFKDLYLSGTTDSVNYRENGTSAVLLRKHTTNSYSAGTGSKTSGDFAVSIGTNAGANSTSSSTIYIGNNSGRYVSTGVNNVAVGFGTLLGVVSVPTTGGRHTAVGTNCLTTVQGASVNNTGLGSQALQLVSTGSCNTGIGRDAGNAITTGSDNTFLGCDSDGSATSNNQTAIGHGAVCDSANQITLGDSAVTQIRPSSTGLCDLGGGGNKFRNIYLSGDIDAGGSIVTNEFFQAKSYDADSTPTVGPAGSMIYIPNQSTFTNGMIAFSDGTNWRNCADGIICSGSGG